MPSYNDTWRALSHYFYKLPKVVCRFNQESYFNKSFNGVCLLFFLIGWFGEGLAYHAQDFSEAKKIARIVWAEKRETFYCGCRYDPQGNIDFKTCAYVPRDKRQNKRISWEHVVPVSWYGRHRACWKANACFSKKGKPLSGRACCQKQDPLFRKMESELYNLVPEVRELNMKRRHYAYTGLPQPYSEEGGCSFHLDEGRKRVEPRDEVKGMAARITLYVTEKYQISMEKEEKKLLKVWDRRFPPTAWERRWHEQVAAIQGDRNPFIDYYNNDKKRG